MSLENCLEKDFDRVFEIDTRTPKKTKICFRKSVDKGRHSFYLFLFGKILTSFEI